jgi:hypothetical protein
MNSRAKEELDMGLQLRSDLHRKKELLRVVELPNVVRESEQINPSPIKGRCNERKLKMAD